MPELAIHPRRKQRGFLAFFVKGVILEFRINVAHDKKA
jgi:hypothetical protein